MWVTILPFFLVANISVDDPHRQTEWTTFGPECTYDVLVNMSLANVVQENDNFCAMISSELKCRPKGDDSLSCHFQNSRIKRPDPKDNRCSNAKDFVPTRYKFVGDKPFEIRFNSRGIQNLVVYKSIPRWELDMIKVMVSQLNVGFDMQERRDRFTIMENSTMGHCEVDVKIIRKGLDSEKDDDDSVEEGENFELGFMPSNVKLARSLAMESLRVEKIRQPKRCPRRTIYFFGDHEDFSHGDKQLYMDMTTSSSRITISKDKFVSYTVIEGVMQTGNESRIMRPYQKISLKLKRIDLAKTSKADIPEIPNPGSTSLFAFSNLRTIPEDA